LDKSPLLFPQLCFTALGDLQGIVAYRLDIKGDIEGQEVGERLNRQAIRDERGPLRLHEEQLRGDRLGEESGQRAERGRLATPTAAVEQARTGELEGTKQGPE